MLRPRDPETAALILQLIERYAQGVRDKTPQDRALEQRLSADPSRRRTAQRLITGFRKLPASQRQAALGKWADLNSGTRVDAAQYGRMRQRLAKYQIVTRADQPEDRDADRSRGTGPKSSRSEDPSLRDEPASSRPEVGEQAPFRDWDLGTPRRDRGRVKSQDQERSRGRELQKKGSPRGPGQRPRPGGDSSLNASGLGTVLPVSFLRFQPRPLYQLYFNGLWCHHETDDDHLTDSDEIYVIITVTDSAGNSVTSLRPTRGDPPYYWDVDSGEYRPKSGNIARVWGGSQGKTARDLNVTVWVWEQDSGNPPEVKEAVDLVWEAALAICGATVSEAGPVPCVISLLAAGVVDAVVAIMTGGPDDLVEVKSVDIAANEIENWVEGGLRTFRREDIPCHFRTIHNGSFDRNTQGADYHVYFAFHEPLPPE